MRGPLALHLEKKLSGRAKRMHPNAIGGIALSFPLTIVVLAVFMWRNGTEARDMRAINELYFELTDERCRDYLQSVDATPGWRRTTIAALVIALLVLPVAWLVHRVPLTAFCRLSVVFAFAWLAAFCVIESSRGYFNYHIMCPRTCNARKGKYPY